MDEKISLNAIEKYSEAYSQKILDAFFRDKQNASGKDLMTQLCGIQQINHFILLELFGAWREENEKIKAHISIMKLSP